MARFTNPCWKQAPGGHWWYYGDDMDKEYWSRERLRCYAIMYYPPKIGVREPGGEIGDAPQHLFPTLEAAKAWVEIEASNHVW